MGGVVVDDEVDIEPVKPALDCAFGHARLFCHSAHAPVQAVVRLSLWRGVGDFGDLLILTCPGSPGTKLIRQSIDTVFAVALATLTDREVAQTHAFGDGRIGPALGTKQNVLRALDQAVGRPAGTWRGRAVENFPPHRGQSSDGASATGSGRCRLGSATGAFRRPQYG